MAPYLLQTSYALDRQRGALAGSHIVENAAGLHFTPPLLDADSDPRGVTGLRCSSAWIAAVRPPRRQALDPLHPRSWGNR